MFLVYLQSPLQLFITKFSKSVLLRLHLTILVHFENISNSQILFTVLERQVKLCTYYTAPSFSIFLHSIRCLYVSADGPISFTILSYSLPSTHTSALRSGQESIVIPNRKGSVWHPLPAAATILISQLNLSRLLLNCSFSNLQELFLQSLSKWNTQQSAICYTLPAQNTSTSTSSKLPSSMQMTARIRRIGTKRKSWGKTDFGSPLCKTSWTSRETFSPLQA